MNEQDTESPGGSAGSRRRSRARDDRSFLLRYGKQILVFVGGLLLIAVGGLMLVTPGPGWLAIFGGLALWATEFEWAERHLDRFKDRFDAVARKAGVDPKKAAIGGILVLVLLTVGGTVAWLLLT